jgi:hypothetical protein
MGFNFPNSPSQGQLFQPPGGPSYTFKNGVWQGIGASGQVLTADSYSRIVNGAMQISQENGRTASTANFYYAVDQWLDSLVGITGINFQSNAGTTGADANLQMNFGIAKPSLAAGDLASFQTKIEGLRVADFRWGTAGALPIVVRFEALVASGGTYTIAILNGAADRTYLTTFTLTAGQWTTVTLKVPGDTTGTWPVDNTAGLQVLFGLAVGTNFQGVAGWQAGAKYGLAGMSNAAASVQNFFVRNIGLYLDPNATGVAPAWVTPDFASELIACKRYWQSFSGLVIDTSGVAVSTIFPVEFRTAPAYSGGGAGFIANQSITRSAQLYQTARNYQTLVMNARM